jgi:hypothetical protein
MRKDILVFIITTSILGAAYGGLLVTKAWADGLLKEYVTIVAWNEEIDSIKGEIRGSRIDAIQDRIDELEWTKTQRSLSNKEAWELQKRRTDLRRLQ